MSAASHDPQSGSPGALRIAFLTESDPYDRRSWSGIFYCMAKSLEKHCGEVLPIGPITHPSTLLGKMIKKGFNAIGRNYHPGFSPRLSKKFGRIAATKLNGSRADLIYAPAASGLVAYLDTDIPIVYTSDTTFQLMIGYYPEFSGLPGFQIRAGNEIEGRAIRNARVSIFPSHWAAQSAVEFYGASPSAVKVAPLGANFDDIPPRSDVLRGFLPDRCSLLFVGVDWERKGGGIALETLKNLRESGVKAELTIVGCTPPAGISLEGVKVFPRLDKNVPAQREELRRLYLNSDFFLLPTRAECYGIVFCESSAFGLPILTAETGGLTEIVRHDVNGFLFPLSARGDQYAEQIRKMLANPESYRAMRQSCRDEYETRLNWDAWGIEFNRIVREMLVRD